jgi:hypothetical protein
MKIWSVLFVCLMIIAVSFYGRVSDFFALWQVGDSVEERVEFQLQRLNKDAYEQAIEAAIEDGDFSTAANIGEMARTNKMPLSPDLIARTEPSFMQRATVFSKGLYSGAVTGEITDSSSMTAALVTDLSGVGDVLDIYIHGQAAIAGEPYVKAILGLAAAGAILTVATLTTGGAAGAGDAGVSVLKNVYKGRKISAPLRRHIDHHAAALVDTKKLGKAFDSVSMRSADELIPALRTAIRPQSLKALKRVSANLGDLVKNGGMSSATGALRLAKNTDELAGFAKMSRAFGKRSAAVMALIGSSFMYVSLALSTIITVLSALIGWTVSFVVTLYKIGRFVKGRM